MQGRRPSLRQGHVCKTLLDQAVTDEERAPLQTQFEQWDERVTQLWAELTAAVNSALPPTLLVFPDPNAAIYVPSSTDIEIRGRHAERAVAIRLNAAQATAIGTTLIALAAALTDRTDGHVAAILPAIPTAPPGQPIRTA
ncbi:hypothetical protein ACFQX7_28255 [Luedemannella flava]